MHCLEISLIEVKKIIIIIIKISSVALAFSQACGWRHLALQRGFWNWSSVAWMLAYVSPRGGKRSLLFTLGAAFKVPPFHGLFCSLKKECLCPWAPGRVSPLFGHGFGVLVCFHSFGVRGGVSTGWEILILKQLEPSLLPFLSPSLKTKEYSPNL